MLNCVVCLLLNAFFMNTAFLLDGTDENEL